MNSPFLSIVSPVYQAEGIVSELVEQIRSVLRPMGCSYEIILVEDCSPDDSWEEIQKICSGFQDIIGIRLSRNFGQHYAIAAGLRRARGTWVVVMDCDLQDSPSEIPKLLAVAQQGFDIVTARRVSRNDHVLKKAASRAFYGVLGYLTGVRQDPAVANFGIYGRKVINAINGMPETIRYFPSMVRWVGFHSSSVDVAHLSRLKGASSYSLRKLWQLALDICLTYSDKPLRLVIRTGFIISGIGFLFAGYTITKAIQGEIAVLGYASIIVSVWILTGMTIFIIGVVGLYVGKVFDSVKRRPSFIISDEIDASKTTGA
jgi:dolichol-phosphate mannosyltransferase